MKINKNVLFIGAHSDDVEYCAGGLACLLARSDFKVTFLNVACKRRIYGKDCDAGERRTLYGGESYRKSAREQDLRAAAILSAEKIIIGESDDSFYECTNASVYMMKDVIEDINPGISFILFPRDNHPDHSEVSRASFRALTYFSSCEIHAFEAGAWQTMVYFYPDYFINIETAMDRVKESLMVFDQPSAKGADLWAAKTQYAGYRGYMAGCGYAEAYKIIRFPSAANGPELLLPKLFGDNFRWAGAGGQYPWGSQYFNI